MTTTFLLVHGAFHGAWCWDLVVPELTARGYGAVAVELPCDDASAGLAEYATVIETALSAHDEVVLVGHSLGGLSIPIAGAHPAVRRMVFLCAAPTGPGPAVEASLPEMVTDEWLAAPRFHDAEGREVLDNAHAGELFFHDCPEPMRSWAVARLRPQGNRPLVEASPLVSWPEVPQGMILGAEDRVFRLSYALEVARQRLSEDPMVLPGGHSPFLARPTDLAQALISQAEC